MSLAIERPPAPNEPRACSRGMRQLLRWALWACLCAALLAPLPVWAETPTSAETVFPLAPGVITARPPVVTLDAAGHPHLLWSERTPEGGTTRLMVAGPPEGQARTLTEPLPQEEIPALAPLHPGYAITAGTDIWAAWVTVEGGAPAVSVSSAEGRVGAGWRVPPEAEAWSFGLDAQGGIVGVWWSPGKIGVYAASEGVTHTLAVDSARRVERLQLALGAAGEGFVAWSAREVEAEQTTLWYAPLTSGGAAVPVADGLLADLALGPEGALHLAWFTGEGLYYGNNHSRDSRRLVVPGLSPTAGVALAGGGGATAHLAWVQDGQLWYATSADWELSRMLLAQSVAAPGPALAVDDWNVPRLAWMQNPSAQEPPSLHLLRPYIPAPSLQVTWPLEGQMVTGDTVARVAANRPPADWRRIEFYLQEDGPADGQFGLLRELGSDHEGADGWQALLSAEGLDPERRYRVVALGVTQDNGTLRAESGWFRVGSDRELWLWPQPYADELSGEIVLAISPPAHAEDLTRLELYLSTEHTHILQANGPAPADHLVVLEVEGARQRPRVRLDTRQLPDGTYYLSATGHTVDGQRIPGRALAPLRINNALAPLVTEIDAEVLDATTGETELLAYAEAAHRQPDRVGFYLQRIAEPGFRGLEPAMADLVWVGNGEPSDGVWRTRLHPEAAWYDQYWVIWAMACDDADRCTTAHSGDPRVIWPGPASSLTLAQPTGKAPLRGVETIRLAVGAQAGTVISATIWLEQPDGGLLPLGELDQEQSWSLAWDTTRHPDGAYRLLIWATPDDGASVPIWSEALTILNRQPNWSLVAPVAAQRLDGITPIVLAPLEDAPPLERVSLYCRDAQGALIPLGAAQPVGDEWRLLWNTHTALDGAHVLVAELTAATGETYYLEHAVEVQNARPSITLLQGPGAAPVRGMERTVWYAQHPVGREMTVTVAYSPDGGAHWLPLSPPLPSGVSLTWDSTAVPDSDAAYLRLTVSDGVYARQVIHGPFVVANVNDPPAITLLQPQPGDALGHTTTIAWQAADADAQEIEVTLYARQGDGPWQPLADGLPAIGRYTWDTTEMAPGEGYTVRVVARDAEGAIGIALAEELAVVDNAPPEVELVWPNEHVRLSTEAVILWRAHDTDGDPLSVDLYYSDNGGLIWYPLAEDLRDSGYYVWQVSFLPPGGSYRLKVVARDAYFVRQDEGHGLIKLGDDQPPPIELLAPVAGASLSGVWPIRWWTVGVPPQDTEIDILTRIAGWDQWLPLAEGLQPEDSYLWDTRRYSNGTYDLLVRALLGGQRSLTRVVSSLRVHNQDEQPPRLELRSPLGGEFWAGMHEIRWLAQGEPGHALQATIEVSPDGGRNWRALATVDAAQGRYLWQTRDWPAGHQYLARVTISDGEATTMATSPGAFSLIGQGTAPPHIILTSPGPSGALLGDALITWIAEDADGDPLLIDIALSADGGRTWQTLAERLLNTGEYALENPLASDGVYQVALMASDGTHRVGVRSASFAGAPAERRRPHVRLEAPAGSATLTGRVEIRWLATDPAGLRLQIALAYSADGGHTWAPIAAGLENSGAHLWDTRSLPNGVYWLRLTADNGRVRESVVGEPFTVANPGRNTPQLAWVGTTLDGLQTGAQELRWRAWDADGDPLTLELAYSLGPYGPWLPLAHGLANTGSYVWDPTAVPSTADLWLRLTASDGRLRTTLVSQGPLSLHHPASPRVQILNPQGGEVWTGKQPIRWRVTHGGGPVEVVLQRSLDGGLTWETLAQGLAAVGDYVWDTAQAPDGSAVLLRILAARGATEGAASLRQPIVVGGNERRELLPLPFR